MHSSCLVIAHRGVWGPASPSAPAENTLEAFEAAIALGADMIEFDVRRTRDGHLVVFHDARVRTVPTSSLRYDALKVKGTTSRPPLLADVVALTKGKIALNVELKEPGYVDDTIALLRPVGLDHCLLSLFFEGVLRESKAVAPELRTGLLIAAGFRKSLTIRLHASRADCLALHRRLATATALASAAAAGIPCVIWTVNASHSMDRYLSHAAVEGLVTDRPALAMERRSLLWQI